MHSQTIDIRHELGNRMSEIEEQIELLKEERNAIDKKIQEADSRLAALRTIYQMENERLGRIIFVPTKEPSRFAGMKVTEALSLIRREQPEITKGQALRILKRQGFDFRGKKPRRVINLAWINLERSKS